MSKQTPHTTTIIEQVSRIRWMR